MLMSDLTPEQIKDLVVDLEWQFRNAKGYENRRIGGTAAKTITQLQAQVKELEAALELASLNFNRSTKYGKGWHDALAYVKQGAATSCDLQDELKVALATIKELEERLRCWHEAIKRNEL